MDPEIKRQLEEIHALVKDNHLMLRTIRREHWFGIVIKFVFWIIMIGVPLYYYQQYLHPFIAKFQATGVPVSGPFGLPTSADLQKLLESFRTK